MVAAGFSIDGFRTDLDTADTYPALGERLAHGLSRLGFVAFNYGAPEYDGSLLSSMDRAWIEQYLAAGYFRSDKLVIEASRRTSPFRASDIFTAPPGTARQAEMVEAISPFPDGLVIPLHCPIVGFALLAAYVGPGDLRLDGPDIGLVAETTLFAHVFHDRAREFYRHNPHTDGRAELSTRELEVLRWAGEGKTAEEAAELLGLSAHTVRNHLASVRRKLNAPSTAAAVALNARGAWRDRPTDQN